MIDLFSLPSWIEPAEPGSIPMLVVILDRQRRSRAIGGAEAHTNTKMLMMGRGAKEVKKTSTVQEEWLSLYMQQVEVQVGGNKLNVKHYTDQIHSSSLQCKSTVIPHRSNSFTHRRQLEGPFCHFCYLHVCLEEKNGNGCCLAITRWLSERQWIEWATESRPLIQTLGSLQGALIGARLKELAPFCTRWPFLVAAHQLVPAKIHTYNHTKCTKCRYTYKKNPTAESFTASRETRRVFTNSR